LVQILGDLGTCAGHILSSEAIQAVLGDDFPVPLDEIERWLSPEGRRSPRGCQIIDADLDELDPEVAEALADQEAEELEEPGDDDPPELDPEEGEPETEPNRTKSRDWQNEPAATREQPETPHTKEIPEDAASEPEQPAAKPKDPREAAVEQVRQVLKEWLHRGKKHVRSLVAVQVAAGFGKTHNMLLEQQRAEPIDPSDIEGLLNEDLGDLPEHDIGKLACAVPRHTLAAEIQETDAALRPPGDTTRIPILTGRNVENCARWPVVDAGFKKGFSQASFCRQQLPDGSEKLCPFFAQCQTTPGQYQHSQTEIQKANNAIVMHAHLAVPWLSALALKTRTRMWMDEDPTQVFRSRQEFDAGRLDLVNEQDLASLDSWCAKDPTAKRQQRRTRKAFENLTSLAAVLLSTLATPAGLKLDHLAAWTPGEVREMGWARETIETWRRGKIDPSLGDNDLKAQLAKRKPVLHLTHLLCRLADELEARKKGPVYSLGRNPTNGKIITRGRIPTDDLPPNLLITDATLSREILEAVFPGYELEHVKIDVPRNALIAQVKDLTFSKNWLLKKEHLPEVTTWLEQLAQYYKELAVITTKRIRCEITGEDHKAKQLPTYCETYYASHGLKIGHYSNITGTNAFKNCDALVILGREQPPPEDIEEIAKAFWYDTDKPLRLAKTVSGEGKVYSPGKRSYERSDGTKVKGEVEVHLDPRCQAVLASTRENPMIQALDRARLVWNTNRKPIYILCNIPLPGVKIDRLVSWDNLRGKGRLNQALSSQAARGEYCLPLEPGWITAHYPRLWKDYTAAKNFADRDPEVLDITRKHHASNIYFLLEGGCFLEIAIVEYLPHQRQPGHNQWSKALVWGDIAPGASLARALDLPETAFRWRPA
jgi:hypothetical protein